MTKTELHKVVTTKVVEVLKSNKVKDELVEQVVSILDNYLKPKKSGLSIEDFVKRDKDGNIIKIQDGPSGIFLDANLENFYEAKNGAGIEVKTKSGKVIRLRRLSRQAEKIRKAFEKNYKAEEKRITTEVLDGKLTPEEGKKKLAELKQTKPDYSVIANRVSDKNAVKPR